MMHLSTRSLSIAAAIGIGLALGACESSSSPMGASGNSPLENTAWRVESIEGQAVAANIQSTMTVEIDDRITGTGGCNNYFGLAVIEGNSFSMGPVGATRMACPETMMEQEQRFFEALSKVQRFETKDGQLFLYDENGNALLRLSRANAT